MTTQVQNQPKRFGAGIIILGIVIIIVLSAVPLVIFTDTEFRGSDVLGAETIENIAPDYDSGWSTNIWEPPGVETESMLFALQAAAGGVLIGYFFGFYRGRKKGKKEGPVDDLV